MTLFRLSILALGLAAGCSARNCDNDALSAGLGGGGGEALGGGGFGMGAMGGAGGAGGGPQGGGGEGGSCDTCGGSECVSLSDDAENCGICGHLCQSGVCRQGACVMDESVGLGPLGLDVDGDDLIYTRGSSYESIPLMGTTSTELFGGLSGLADIRVAGGSYFISDIGGLIYKVPPGVHTTVDPSWIRDTMDPGIPLLATAGLGTCWTKPEALRCEVNGALTPDITLAPDVSPGGLYVDNARVYYTVSIGQLASVALLDTTNLITHATGLPTPIYGVEIRSLEAFVASGAGLYRVNLNDSTVAEVHAAPIQGGTTMGSTSEAVYVASLGGASEGILWRFPLVGGEPEVLFRGGDPDPTKKAVFSLVLEGGFIYFSSGDALYRRALGAPSFD